MSEHGQFMERAVELARLACEEGEVPVGAVIVRGGQILGEGRNSPIRDNDPTSHAEINAIRAAAEATANYRLPGTTLYVTLEPCVMCAGAILHARIENLIFGAWDERAGAAGGAMNVLQSPLLNHHCSIESGVCRESCEALLLDFFTERRE